MCGIIGLINKEDVAVKLFYGMMSLQHRGQDAAGILTSQGNEFFIEKNTGLVQDIFKKDVLDKLKGTMGIGHTRYSTSGSVSKSNSQPLLVNSSNKMALAHNGHIVNYGELKENLRRRGVFLTTTVDDEPVLQLLALKYEETNDFFEAAEYVLKNVKGSYSIVGIIAGKGLFALRDPKGIRPFVIGRKDGSYAFSSESVALQTIGYEFERDVKPGEAIFIDEKTMEMKSKVIVEEKRAHCMFEWIYFSRPETMIEERAVYKARLALGIILAEKLKGEEIDVVIPVPDTARSCAIKVAEVLGVKYREGLIKNRYIGRTFIMPSQDSREYYVNMKLDVIFSTVKDQNVVVVDDSIVRGTTSMKIVKKLKKAGAKKVIFASACPPVKYPCYYGIDMSTETELIAHEKSIEEIREFLGVDKLIYTTVEDVKKAIRRDICCACLNKDYPVELTDEEKEVFRLDKKNR